MEWANPQVSVLRIGAFELNLSTGELRKAGSRIRLQPQPFKVLALLLERPGELVTREELQQKLWSEDTFVDFEHALNFAVKKLRQALGDDADHPRYIETLPRRGYRFIGPVERVARPAVQGGAAHQPATAPPGRVISISQAAGVPHQAARLENAGYGGLAEEARDSQVGPAPALPKLRGRARPTVSDRRRRGDHPRRRGFSSHGSSAQSFPDSAAHASRHFGLQHQAPYRRPAHLFPRVGGTRSRPSLRVSGRRRSLPREHAFSANGH